MDGSLIVVAEMKAKAGLEAELRRRAVALVEPTRREAGCLQYHLHECDAEPGRFLFYEIWASRAAWEAHLRQPRLVEFLGRASEWLAEPARVTTYAKLV
jgi:quinol monooxygenase YgiN